LYKDKKHGRDKKINYNLFSRIYIRISAGAQLYAAAGTLTPVPLQPAGDAGKV
jgi:hypothetical protein